MSKNAWVTLTTNDSYALGALVLAHSLRRQDTLHQLAVLVTPGVSPDMLNKLRSVFDLIQEVNILDSQDAANLALLARPELGITFTKLHCWRLVQYEKCVFLDSDTMVLQNCDELFEREELSAAPDVSWPDCFNSGVFVYQPNMETYAKITEFALKNGSFDGGDQGLLNSYFSDWAHTDIKKHLPFIYNVTAFASYCYLPAFKQFRDKIKILHFAGKLKPWLVNFNSENQTATAPTDYSHAADLIQLWWNIFCEDVHQELTSDMNYWPAILHWNYASKAQCDYLEMQQHYHYYENQTNNNSHNENNDKQCVMPPVHYAYDEVREYHDPWEDYYKQLEEQHNQMNTLVTWHSNDNNDNYHNNMNYNNNNDYSDNEHDNKPLSPPPPLPPTPPPPAASREMREIIVEKHRVEDVIESPVSTNLNVTHIDNTHTVELITAKHNYAHETSINNNNSNHDANKHEVITNEHVHETRVVETTVNDERSERYTNQFVKTTTSLETIHVLTDIDTESHICTHIESNVNEESGLAGALSQLRLGEPRTPEQEAYEQVMRRQAWEQGEIDYTGKDSFDNIWKRITKTLESKPTSAEKDVDPATSDLITSADIEDGKIEYDPVTKAKIQYKVIDGGYEVVTTTPQPNGTVKTQTRTFWDPKPVSAEDLLKEQENKRLVKKRFGKEIRIDSKTTMLTREIEGGYEEVYTVTNEDGTKSVKVKTFYDSVPEGQGFPNAPNTLNKQNSVDKRKKQLINRNSSVDSTDSTESRQITQRKNVTQSVQDGKNTQTAQYQEESTFKETRRMSQNVEITQNSRTVRKNSTQEQSIQAISSANVDNKDSKKKKKTKSSIPPPPSDFIENDTTEVSKKRVPGGVEYTYTTQLESGKTITTSKTIYEEEETELTEEEIREYKKTLKDAQKHKNVTSTKKLRSESGTKQVVPSENPGDVTTVETIRIEGGTEYHYTTVTSEGIVKKAVKTVYDPVPINKDEYETEEEEIVEDYEEEIIEPGEKNIRTIESIKKLPSQFHEEVTITKEKKEKKVKRSMVISN